VRPVVSQPVSRKGSFKLETSENEGDSVASYKH
jgi:hypothetical protein